MARRRARGQITCVWADDEDDDRRLAVAFTFPGPSSWDRDTETNQAEIELRRRITGLEIAEQCERIHRGLRCNAGPAGISSLRPTADFVECYCPFTGELFLPMACFIFQLNQPFLP